MDDLHEILSVQHCCIDGFSVQYNNKKTTFWVFIQLIRWARCDLLLYFYCNWQLSKKTKKKTTTGSGREWESFFREWERDFPPVFSWDWDGKRLKFVMHFGNRRWAPGLMRHLAWETRSQDLLFSHIWVAHIFWMPSAEFKWAILI